MLLRFLKSRLYFGWLLFLVVGGIWLFLNIFVLDPVSHFTVCFFKQISGIPCPGCGTTRAVITLLSGDVIGSCMINPLALFAAMAVFVGTSLFIGDWVLEANQFEKMIFKFNSILKNPYVFATVLIIICLNWYWNIAKDL